MTAERSPGGYDEETLALYRLLPFKPLQKTLTHERAVELLGELGFLGVVDLVALMAEGMNGSIECESERYIVKIKRKPRPRGQKKARAVRRSSG